MFAPRDVIAKQFYVLYGVSLDCNVESDSVVYSLALPLPTNFEVNVTIRRDRRVSADTLGR